MPIHKLSFLATLMVCLVGCTEGSDRASTGNFPLDQISVDSELRLVPATGKGSLFIDFITAGPGESSAPALGTISGSALLTDRDRIQVVNSENRVSVSESDSSIFTIYGAHFNFNSSENTSIQYVRGSDVANEILLQINQNLLPSIELDRTELVGADNVLEAKLDIGFPDGYKLPAEFFVTVQSTTESCETNGVPFVVPDDHPSKQPEVISSTLMGTLEEGDLSLLIEASTIIGGSRPAFSAGTITSCSYEVFTVVSTTLGRPFNGSDELISITKSSESPRHEIRTFVHSIPQIVRVHRSAL